MRTNAATPFAGRRRKRGCRCRSASVSGCNVLRRGRRKLGVRSVVASAHGSIVVGYREEVIDGWYTLWSHHVRNQIQAMQREVYSRVQLIAGVAAGDAGGVGG